jgi:hypothetical protein
VAPCNPVANAWTCVLAVVSVKSTLALLANNVNNCCAEFNTGVVEVTPYKPVVLVTAMFAEAIFYVLI